MRFLKWLTGVVSYLLYSLAVLAFMLWYQFPAEVAKNRLEFELNRLTPDLQWEIGRVGLGLPADFLLTDIKLAARRQPKKSLVRIESLSLRPNLPAYLQARKLSAGYRLTLLGGRVSGHLSLSADHNSLQYDGKANGIKINGLEQILQGLDRTIAGILSGSFTGKAVLDGPGLVELQGTGKLLKGEMSFRQPVLGMKKLEFNQLSSQIRYRAGEIFFADGRLESRLLAGEFSGTVKDGDDLGRSTLKLSGVLIPRPEFLAGLGDGTTVKVLKKRLQGGKLPFTVSGTLKEPGIVFSGLPAGFTQQPRGGRE
jgi:type II secretion system protein N